MSTEECRRQFQIIKENRVRHNEHLRHDNTRRQKQVIRQLVKTPTSGIVQIGNVTNVAQKSSYNIIVQTLKPPNLLLQTKRIISQNM